MPVPPRSLASTACLLLTLLFTLPPLAAHETRPAYLEIRQLSDQHYDFTFRQPQIEGRFLGLTVESDCAVIGEQQHRVTTAALESHWRADCHGLPIRDARLGIAGLDRTLIDTLVHIVFLQGAPLDTILTPREWRLEPVGSAGPDFLPTYFVLGVEHLLLGLDHVAFLLILLYLIRDYKKLIIAVTSFTVAHSITLGLAAFNLLQVPQKPVEAVIALSILIVAWEVTQAIYTRPDQAPPDKPPLILTWPWLLTFVFGLLHGLGFASAMAEIGLPEDSALWALALFNLGIEAGQLLVILAVLLSALLLRLTGMPRTTPIWVQQAPVYAIGGLAGYWFIDRTSGMLLGL